MELVVDIAERPSEAQGAGSQFESGGALTGAMPATTIPAEALRDSTDDALVRAALTGQNEAFSELVRRYTKLLFWYVNGRLKNAGEVDEVTQEAMVRAYVDLPKLRVPRAFPNWLISIASTVLREKHRSDSKIINIESPDDAAAPKTYTPVETLTRAEMRDKLRIEMQRLPDHYRVVLALKYMNGFSVEETASKLLLPEGTVRSRLSRAYAILQQRLESGDATDTSASPTEGGDHQQEENS